jgi:shikimate dehydrogenase
MRKFGLIGFPLGHSFSKKYFAEKFAKENITDCSYENFPIQNLNLFPEFIAGNPELCGLNVTIPYKTEILKYINEFEPAIDEIGAVNVLKIKRINGETWISGYNSDITGIRDSILPVMNDSLRSALILGTGGSSGAVSYALRKLGMKVTLVSRKRRPGVIGYEDITAELLGKTDLIVNTTPLGLFPNTTAKPEIDYSLLNKNHILFDLVYNPELTSFLEAGKERGCKIITGLIMLYSQADRSWEIWNDDKM